MVAFHLEAPLWAGIGAASIGVRREVQRPLGVEVSIAEVARGERFVGKEAFSLRTVEEGRSSG